MAEIVFWSSIGMVIYIYLGYPALAYILGSILKRDVRKAPCEPLVSVIICAHNEEKYIGETIKNKLSLDYPHEKMEILIVSDGSTDKTEDIVNSFVEFDPRVKLIVQEPRAGKTAGLNRAVPLAKGEVVVFSDANSIYASDALKMLVQNFSDPQVGYVTGQMVYVHSQTESVGEACSGYMKYENLLRKYESSLGSIVGVDGGIDAMRQKLFVQMNPDQLPDFVLPLRVIEQGHRVVYEPAAKLREQASKTVKDEYRMRVRVSLRAFWALWDMRHLLSFERYGLFAWQLLSHKCSRYLAFVFLVLGWLSNMALWGHGSLYKVTLILQSAAYLGAAFSGPLGPVGWSAKLMNFLHYFVLLNVASAHAFAKFLLGKKQIVWTPRVG